MRPGLTLEYADVLAKVDLFSRLDRVTLAKLAAHLEPVPVEHGTDIVREGDPGDAFYVVVRGTLGVFMVTDHGDGEKRINTLRAGAQFGEIALLTDQPRTATVRAETKAEVLRLDRARFLELVHREPYVALAIAATLSQRLRAANARALAMAPDTIVDGPADTIAPPEAAAAPAARTPPWRPAREAIGALAALLLLVFTWWAPAPAGLTVNGWRALGTLIAAVPALALDAVPEGVLALTLAAAWVVGDVVPINVALSGFASTSWMLLVSVLVVGAAISSSGLLYRFALWIVASTRGGFPGQVVALSVAGLLIGPAVPNATGRVTLIAPALGELVEALGYAPRSPQAAGIAMAALIGFGQMASVFLTSSTTSVLVFAVLPATAQSDLGWISWAIRAAPPNILLFAGLVIAVILLFRPHGRAAHVSARPEALALQRALLGPPSRAEQICLIVSVGLLLGFITQSLHHIDPGWIGVLALAALAITGVVTADTLRTVNWSFALLFGILTSLSAVFTGVGVDRWIAGIVAATVRDLAHAPVVFIAALTLVCFVVSLVLRWQAAAPLLTIALAPVASAAGISPFVVGLTTVIACNGFFIPYQSTIYLALYHGTGGRLFTHGQARLAAIAYGVLTLVALCASVPVWRAMGLL